MEPDMYILTEIFESYMDRALKSIKKARNRIIQPEPSNIDIIKAIKNRNYVGIYYEDEDYEGVLDGFRLIQPYAFGTGFKIGDRVHYPLRAYIRAYVIMDSSKTKIRRKSVSMTAKKGDVDTWRIFRKDRISDWFTFPYKFSKYKEGYAGDDSMINFLMASLPKSSFPYGMEKLNEHLAGPVLGFYQLNKLLDEQ